MNQPAKPSPYVSLYLPRRQAEEIERLLEQRAAKLSASHVASRALANVREALARNR